MTRFSRVALVVSLVLMSGCGRDQPARPAARPAPESHDVDRAGMDPAVAAGDDFFRYANGAWLQKTEIPSDRSSYGTWAMLIDLAQQRTRGLLEAAAAGAAAAGSGERKIGDYYASYLDEQAIEAKGLTPPPEELKSIAAHRDPRALRGSDGGKLPGGC